MRVPGIPPNLRRPAFELKLKTGDFNGWVTFEIIILKRSVSRELLEELGGKSHGIKSTL